MPDSYDSPWKEILERYFHEFLALFFPGIYRRIDRDRGYVSLDLELQKVVRDAKLGRRFADKLMKVWCAGEERYVLIHVEVQGQPDPDFARRMLVYNYRLFDRYGHPVLSLAVLGDDHADWRPERYEHELWGCRMVFDFPAVKLWDYTRKRAQLEKSRNPFATVVLAHLATQATRADAEERYRSKLRLLRRLYEQGLRRKDVLELFRFIDWLMTLPPELEEKFKEEIRHIEMELKMPYITSVERDGMERGLQQGLEQGLRQGEETLLRRLLHLRFGAPPDWVDERITQAEPEQLSRWAERLLSAATIEQVFAEG